MPTRQVVGYMTTSIENTFTDPSGIADGPYTSVSTDTIVDQTVEENRSGSGNLEWRQLVKTHADATTDFVANRSSLRLGRGGYAEVKYSFDNGIFLTETNYTMKGVFSFPGELPTVDSTILADAIELAGSRAYKKVLQNQSRFNGGEFFGEIRETLKMIRSPAKALSSFILGSQFSSTQKRLSKAGRNKGRPLRGAPLKRSLTKAASDSWLEGVFGWLPLVQDIKDGAQALAAMSVDPDYIPLDAGSTKKVRGPTNRITQGLAGGMTYDVTTTPEWKCVVKVYGEIMNTISTNKAHALGLDPVRDFIPTLWNLLPYSFLVDYFVNVGDVLEGCFVDMGVVNRSSVVWSNIAKNTYTFSDFSVPGAGEDLKSAKGSHPDASAEMREVSRHLGFYIPTPRLQFSFPTSKKRWANMGALIASKYSGLSRKFG